jgi:hypothetical protein
MAGNNISFSDYVVYVDESGDGNLVKPNSSYPIFVLAFCVFKKTSYVSDVSPAIQTFKFKHFGHDTIVLHEREIRMQRKPFVFLKSETKRAVFMEDLNKLVANTSMTVIAAVIDKNSLKQKYKNPNNPYNLAMKFCLERLQRFLVTQGAIAGKTHIIFERRGREEDRSLELEFLRITNGNNYENQPFPNLEIIFADKRVNSGGLQIADLIARPIGIKTLRPDQENRAFDIIKRKLHCNNMGDFEGVGLKRFP